MAEISPTDETSSGFVKRDDESVTSSQDAPAPLSSSTPIAGQAFGKFELIHHLASGGMAEIHLARARGIEDFQKIVVIKRALPQFAADEEFVRMFLDEARLAATLSHPNIVQVHDVGIVDGAYFFAMEFIHGEDGRTILATASEQGCPIPMAAALSIVIGMCAALHYAHEKRGFDGKPLDIIHRDVSPSNVIVGYDGSVKVVDFGIAKAASRRSKETRAGEVKGKFSYMSPEQCTSGVLDRRSDVFALAICLFELTTRTKLFRGKSDYEIMRSIVEHDAPLPSTRVPGYPAELERIVKKGLARDRNQRYASAEELQLDLEAFAREEKVPVSPITLARFMESLFGAKIEAWRSARAGGRSLADHLATRSSSPGALRAAAGGKLGSRVSGTRWIAFAVVSLMLVSGGVLALRNLHRDEVIPAPAPALPRAEPPAAMRDPAPVEPVLPPVPSATPPPTPTPASRPSTARPGRVRTPKTSAKGDAPATVTPRAPAPTPRGWDPDSPVPP